MNGMQPGYPPQGMPPQGGYAPPQGMPPQYGGPPQGMPQQGQMPPQGFQQPQQPQQQPQQGGYQAYPQGYGQSVAVTTQFFEPNYDYYTQQAKEAKAADEGDFLEKFEGNQDGSMRPTTIRIAPSVSQDGRIDRRVTKYYVPKSFTDESAGFEVFQWPEDATQKLGVKCPVEDALNRLKQLGVPESCFSGMLPSECIYVQGWVRDPNTMVSFTRNKPKFINLKQTIFNSLISQSNQNRAVYGNVYSPYEGWDVTIGKSGKGMQTRYTTSITPVMFTGGRGPLLPDPNATNECINQLIPLTEKFPVPNPEAVAAMQVAATRIFDHFSRMAMYGQQQSVPGYNPTAQYPQLGQQPQQGGFPPQGQMPPQQQPGPVGQPMGMGGASPSPMGMPPQGMPPQAGRPPGPPQGPPPGMPMAA